MHLWTPVLDALISIHEVSPVFLFLKILGGYVARDSKVIY